MKMYVLVRKDLGPSYAAVQAGHALAEFMIYSRRIYEHDDWRNGTLIYLGVKDQNELLDWLIKADEIADTEYFVEPDIGNQTTAFAALDYDDGRLENLFKDLDLL